MIRSTPSLRAPFLRTGLFGTALASALALSACMSQPMAAKSGPTTMSAPAPAAAPMTMSMQTFRASLSAAAEVPPNASTATGTTEASFDKATSMLKWRVTYSGLTGPATAGHIHGPALPGANAGVVVPFPNIASPAEGSATLTAAQVADLMAGKWYVNIHTAQNPGGEIRGQLMVN